MKNIFFILFLALLNLTALPQQKPQYTQYIFNNYLLNPAISGIENYIDVKAGYRNQWTGLEGAPVTSYFSIHAPIGKRDLSASPTSFGGQENNPLSRSYVPNYQASSPHHGIGLFGVFDQAGPINWMDVNATYAYHLGISARTNLSFGIAAGISSVTIDRSKLIFNDERSDPVLTDNIRQQLKPDLAAGLWFYGPLYFVGLSGQQLLPQNSGKESSSTGLKQVPHFFLTAGYKFFATEDIAAIPSVIVRKVRPASDAIDFNMKLSFRDRFWLGGGYRNKDSFSALSGFYFSNFVNLSYSYDFTISDLANTSKGTHEFVIGFLLDNTYKVICPQRNW